MRIGSAILIVILSLALASPAAANTTFSRDDGDLERAVPIVVDVLVLRPAGMLMTIVGTAFYVFPVVPLTAITRPSDIGKPFKLLVATPARYTFVDPLGQH